MDNINTLSMASPITLGRSLTTSPSCRLCVLSLFATLLLQPCLAVAANSTKSFEGNQQGKPLPTQIHIAVAANFRAPLEALLDDFKAYSALPPADIRVSSGATGTLYKQIVHGAPFDLFFAADTLRPKRLVDGDFASPPSLRVYTRGQLALAYPHLPSQQPNATPSQVQTARSCSAQIANVAQLDAQLRTNIRADHSLEQSNHLFMPRIAIANPLTAPYGQAANTVLQALDEIDRLPQPIQHQAQNHSDKKKLPTPTLKYRLIRGKNILHAQQLLLMGHVDFALLALPQREHKTMSNYVFCPISTELYAAIDQSMVIINQPGRGTQVRQFIAAFSQYIHSTRAQNLLVRMGYLPNDLQATPANEPETID